MSGSSNTFTNIPNNALVNIDRTHLHEGRRAPIR
jgi:hypothetical protein